MELVYLWVEDYKNIHKQGFNFSPRFHCDYEDNKLTICDKKCELAPKCKDNNYIENFFGHNINVTAIVGKNGSGKSSLLKVIRQIIDKRIKDGSFLIFYEKAKNEYICIYTLDKINSNLKFEQYKNMSNHIIFPLFDYSLTYDSSINFKNEGQLPVYPKKLNGFLDFHRELTINQKNIIHNFIDLKRVKLLDKFKDFFQPNEIRVVLDLKNFKPHTDEKLKEEKEIEYKTLIDSFQNQLSIQDVLSSVEALINLLSSGESYQNKEEDSELQLLPTLESELRRLEDENYGCNGEYIAKNIWKEEETRELLICKNKLDSILEIENKYTIFSFDINDSIDDIINIILDSFPLTYFQIEIIDINGKKLSDLSFGEQQLLFILNQIYTLGIQLDQDLYDIIDAEELAEHGIDSGSPDRYYKINYIILFDEIDIGFHPDWQKRMLQYIIDFLNVTDDGKYYHLIFSTHSPFLLSDIPKENIIFLNDEPSIKQTFGANIHTLLSDSFFMENGLMGEFAKSKINEIIKNLQDDEYNPNEQEKNQLLLIIESIGEPFLRSKILDMYNRKFIKGHKEREKKKIEEQINQLKSKLKELDND